MAANDLIQPKGSVSKETNIQSIARNIGIKNELIGYISTTSLIDNYTILYEPTSQTCWYRDNATGIPDIYNINNNILTLVTNIGTYQLYSVTNSNSRIVPTVSSLQNIKSTIGLQVKVDSYSMDELPGGLFIAASSSNYVADGGKIISSNDDNIVFVRDEYYTNKVVRPEWYGCKGKGSTLPDTVPFSNMLKNLNDGDYIKLSPNSIYYNDFPTNTQNTDGWIITKNNITLNGDSSTLSRKTPSSLSYSGFTTLKLTGNNIYINGKLTITSDDPINKPLYGYRNLTPIDTREIYTSPLSNTLSLWAYGVDGLFIDKTVILCNSVFPFFANNGCSNMKIFCTASKSGQIYPQPISSSSDLALGSCFKLDNCSNFIFDVIANDTAYAGIESESNNTNGQFRLITNRAYHAGLHIWGNCKNITYDVSSTDIVEGGGVIIGYGCQSCSGVSTTFNSQYVAAFIGNSETTPVIGCNVKGSGFNVTDGVLFYATSANNAYIQHCNVDITAIHGDYFNIGTGRQSAVKFNGGQFNTIKVNSKNFDYIFSLGMGTNNSFDVVYNKFNTAFSYSDQRSFDNSYRYTDPNGGVYNLYGKGSSYEYRSDAVTNPVLGFRTLNRKEINTTALVNTSLATSPGSSGQIYYDATSKILKINL